MPKSISKEFKEELEDYLNDVARFAKRVGKNELLMKTDTIYKRLQGTVANTKRMNDCK